MAVAAVVAAEGGDAEALTHLRADCSGGPGAYVQPRSNSNSLGECAYLGRSSAASEVHELQKLFVVCYNLLLLGWNLPSLGVMRSSHGPACWN